MRKRGARTKPRRGLHSAIVRGIVRTNRECNADAIARPMRNLFVLLRSGEVLEHVATGVACMHLRDVDASRKDLDPTVPIAPAIRGWVECWQQLDPALPSGNLLKLADCLDAWEGITEELTDAAHEEFETQVRAFPGFSAEHVKRAIKSAMIAVELEKIQEAAA